jgi:hypothetical protein
MVSKMYSETKQPRRAFCRNLARFTTTLAFFPLAAEFFTSCNTEFFTSSSAAQKKKILRPPVEVDNTGILTSTRYIGAAFLFPVQMVSVSLEPNSDRLPPYALGVSFIGIIAQDTLSFGYDPFKPRDIALVGMFKQKNGTFRYGYEINGVRHYARGHVVGSDYKYNIEIHLDEEGLVTDPDHPHERRFGYLFQVLSGLDASLRIQGLQSSLSYANQLFVGVMDENNNVRLPDNKQLQFYIAALGNEIAASASAQTPDLIYRNDDDTSQVSSQFSNSENRVILTLTGSY